jgi:hypothetical protein
MHPIRVQKREHGVAGSEKRFLRHDIGQEFIIILIRSKDHSAFRKYGETLRKACRIDCCES